MSEVKRIPNVSDPKASSIQTDCKECGKEISLSLTKYNSTEDNSTFWESKVCCGYIYTLEDVVDLVVLRGGDFVYDLSK